MVEKWGHSTREGLGYQLTYNVVVVESSYSLKQEEKRQVGFWCCGRNVGCMPFWEGGSVLHPLDDAPISVLLRLGCLSSVRLVSL
jgi:hypothetical protein